MKDKIKSIIEKTVKEESGASTIVEATFVFPIMFFVLFFLIFFSNAYFMKAQVENIVAKAAIDGAMRAQDPYFEYVNGLSKVNDIKTINASPYRYIFTGGMKAIEKNIDDMIKKSIKASGGLLSGMKPELNKDGFSTFNNKVLYSTFVVNVEYKIEFPWRFIFSSKPTILKLVARAEEPVNDTPEFIRNTDMVLDMLDGNETYEKICDKFNKVKDFINNFAQK